MVDIRVDWESGISPPLKKRKLRKGTQSCWECKRRKIRCTFVDPTDSICDGCKSRRVKCISQEFHNEVGSANSRADRLDRVEALVDHLAKRTGAGLPTVLSHEMQNVKTNTTSRVVCETLVARSSVNHSIEGSRPAPGLNTQAQSGYDELCSALLAVWPTQTEFELMVSVDVGIAVLFHGVVCMPYSTLLSRETQSPREMLQLPPPESHPVLIARKLLLLGSFLQGIPSQPVKDLVKQGIECREVMARLAETANRLVTSNDNLVGSIEGIECIMIESMYYNNAGNLRQAWLTNRRAMMMAQMIGLHRSNSSMPKTLAIETQDRIDPGYMWCRLVISDRYLSLLLGLPQGSQENPFATPSVLEGCAPMDRMERMEAIVGGLILQRNRDDLHDLEATREIDKLLQDSASLMPAMWWLPPDIDSITASNKDAFADTMRIMTQFAHHHLIAQLHLPYILLPSADRKYDYSKITAVNASREILSRFVYVRNSDMIAAYCRGVDFLSFIACTTLCLAHIDAHKQAGAGTGNYSSVFQFLMHQRLGDRGLMERMLQIMENLDEADNDVIACKISSILRRLLAIEAAAANGGSYSASLNSDPDVEGFMYSDNVNDSTDALCINFPHFGTIKIEHCGVSRYFEVPHPFTELNTRQISRSNVQASNIRVRSEPNPLLEHARQEQRRETFSYAACSGEYHFGGQSPNASLQISQSHLDSIPSAEQSQAIAIQDQIFGLGEDPLDLRHLLESEIAEDENDWTLQGVDIALFDSLTRGAREATVGGSHELPLLPSLDFPRIQETPSQDAPSLRRS